MPWCTAVSPKDAMYSEVFVLDTTLVEDICRINVDAHFSLSSGAKVNNNKCRVSIVYTEIEGGITDIKVGCVF